MDSFETDRDTFLLKASCWLFELPIEKAGSILKNSRIPLQLQFLFFFNFLIFFLLIALLWLLFLLLIIEKHHQIFLNLVSSLLGFAVDSLYGNASTFQNFLIKESALGVNFPSALDHKCAIY